MRHGILLASLLGLILAGGARAQTESWIIGTVLGTDGEPVEGVEVTVQGRTFEGTRTTNKKGKFTVMVRDPGQYQVRLEKEGFRPFEQTIELPAGGTFKAEWTLESGAVDPAASPLGSPERKNAAVLAYNEGARAYNEGNFAAALDRMAEAVALDPELVRAWEVLAAVHMQREAAEAAAEAAARLLALDPGNIVALTVRYDAAKALGGEDQGAALDQLAAARPGPETAVRLYNAGVALLQAEDTDGAVGRFDQARQMDPSLAAAHAALARIYLGRGEYEKTVARTGEWLKLEADNFEALSIQHAAYRGLGELEKAEAAFAAMAAARPGQVAEMFFRQGEALFEGNDPAAAAEAFRRALAAEPDHPRAHYRLGLCYLNLEETAKAKVELLRFLELAPDDPEAAAAKEMLTHLE